MGDSANTFETVIGVPQSPKGEAASDKEVASLGQNDADGLVPYASIYAGTRVVGSRWVPRSTRTARATGVYRGMGKSAALASVVR